MSTIVRDKIKQRNNCTFPIAESKDIWINDGTTVEDSIKPATNSDLGRVKIGNNILINDGVINIPNYLSVGNLEPDDGSLLWIDTDDVYIGDSLPNIISAEDDNILTLEDDGLFLPGRYGRLSYAHYIDDFQLFLNKTIDIYINSSTGDDDIADGSAAKPFKTFGKMLSLIPTVQLGYNYRLHVKGTFNENIIFANINTGNLQIYMENTPVFNGYIRFYNCKRVYIYRGFKVNYTPPTGTTWYAAFGAYQSSCVYFVHDIPDTSWSITITGTTNSTLKMRGLTAINGSIISCTSSLSTIYVNSCYQAYYSECGELCMYKASSSKSSTYGMVANYGVIRYYNKNNSASTAYSTTGGGRIYGGGQSNIGRY